jgi:hypothetical protein
MWLESQANRDFSGAVIDNGASALGKNRRPGVDRKKHLSDLEMAIALVRRITVDDNAERG